MENKITYKELKELLDSYSSFLSGSYPHKYICYQLNNKNNYTLKTFLEEEGYWKFAPNRSKQLIYEHQIVCFFFNRKGIPNGEGDLLTVHHLSGNTLENNPSNLIYLTSQDHQGIVTKFQRKLTKIKVKQFYKINNQLKESEKTKFNRRGERIRNWVKFIIGVICLTISKSNQWLKNISQPIIKIINFINRWLKRINTIDDNWIENYI